MRTRVTSTMTDTLTWDEFGRLVSFKRVVSGQAAATTTFAYDGFGRRVRKATSATTVHYLWDGDQILAELDGSGVVRKTYTYYPGVDQPRSVTTGGQTYFFSAEPDGTVNGVIRKSDRTVVAQYAYTPWGELESAAQAFDSVSTLRWKGLPYDAEAGLYSMRARYYDPKIRRFVSEDPIGFNGGVNLFEFASGDPLNRSDPSGLYADDPPVVLPGVTVTATAGWGFTGCWGQAFTSSSEASQPFLAYVQQQCPSEPLPSGYQGQVSTRGQPIPTAAVRAQANRNASELAMRQWNCHVDNVNANTAAANEALSSFQGRVIQKVGSLMLGWLMPVLPKTDGLAGGAARLVGSRVTSRVAPPMSAGVAVGSGAGIVGWLARAGGTSIGTTGAFKVGLGLGATYGSWEGCR